MSKALTQGRTAFARDDWADAFAHLSAADNDSPLDPEDLDRLATAAYLIGEDAASDAARTRAHHGFLDRGDVIRAARSAHWLAFAMLGRFTQSAQGGGWLARARRLLDDAGADCVEQGYCLSLAAFMKVIDGDIPAAQDMFRQAALVGKRFGDRDLIALARHGEGRTVIRLNNVADGMAMIDEVMISVTCGEVAPMVAGVVYCGVISACHDLFDLRRAQEWTTALTEWCAGHPDLAAFKGPCLTHRSELLQLHGAWQDALNEAQRACRGRSVAPREIGAANYQLAEVHRLRGEFDQAEAAYRRASQAGHQTNPGLALLRLAQGDLHAAETTIRHALTENRGPRLRAQVLRASVEIVLAAGDLAAGRSGASELAQLAAEIDAPFLHAAAAQARAAVALADGDAGGAVVQLRHACSIWRAIEAPYEIARVRALLGRAYRQLGDEDGAEMEFEAAAETFERLGAAPDAAQVSALFVAKPAEAAGALTGREVEVLRLVATGKTNRAIASDLSISEKTVARHVSNIFVKLDLASRSAATAYAYSHKLL